MTLAKVILAQKLQLKLLKLLLLNNTAYNTNEIIATIESRLQKRSDFKSDLLLFIYGSVLNGCVSSLSGMPV